MAQGLHALGLFCARRPLVAIGMWVLLLLAVYGAVGAFGKETSNDLDLPGTDSQRAQDLLAERFPPQQNGANPILFDVDSGKLTDSANKSAVKASVKALAQAPHVEIVTNPFSSAGKAAGLVAEDGQTAFAPVLLDIGSGELDAQIAQEILDATLPAQDAGITVTAAGSIGTELSDQPTESSEVVGILAAMLILSLVLGSLVAMGLPIITAVFGLLVALGTIGLMGHLLAVPDTADTLATMIGLGVGIDYALFLISRHQDHLRSGMAVHASVARTVATSGSAVVFAGATVIVALVALRVAGIPLLSTLGLASALAVLAAVLAAITLLPAILGLLGTRINSLRVPGTGRPSTGGGMWGAWSGFLSRHPVLVTVASLACLAPLMVPAPSLELGQDDIGATPIDSMERRAYDTMTAGFGVGYNGPLSVASSFDPVVAPSEEYTTKYDKATSLQKQLEKLSKELPEQQQELEAEEQELQAEQQTLLAEQSSLEAQQASLEAQAEELRREGAQLEAEKSKLEREQQALEADKRRLAAERDQLEKSARSLAAQIKPLARRLTRILARERVLEARIEAAAGDPDRQQRLEERLARVQARERAVRAELAPLKKQAIRLAERAKRLEAQAEQLQSKAARLQSQATALEQQAAELNRQKAELQRQADRLAAQAAELKNQAAALQQQADQLQQEADELKEQQKQAQQMQKQAEKLQSQLTDMLTAAGGDPRATDPRVVRLQKALSATAGVQTLTPPQTNTKGDVVLLSAVPTTAPASDETAALLAKVRTVVIPAANAPGGVTSYVGGYTASYVDLATLISNRLLLVIGTVVLLGFLLLMIAFRSLLVPLQAAVTNILSATAAFGILTAAFQWGWGIDLLGIDTASDTVPIASYVPLMMFAVLFGLSMDYEVFLVSHIQQHHLRGEPARQAVMSGLKSSARITSAACLIMTAVFASFILNGDPTIKQFGVGLATAVLLAGILVVTLAPATITLMGERAWWLPRWLDRVLPRIDIEGEHLDASEADSPEESPAEDPQPQA